MKDLLSKLEKSVSPTPTVQTKIDKIAQKVISLVRAQITKYPEVSGVELGGSYAKGTWLREKGDIDVFVKFNPSTSEKSFTNISKKVGFDAMQKFNPYERYSEHPYVEATINGTKVNVVPCYDVKKGNWKSAADRSSYHTKFMARNLSEKMKTDVKILKSLLRNNDLYGAEIAKEGFSGYVCEVLIWNLGSFEKTIKFFSEVKANQTIGNSKQNFDTIITIIDPIDPNRNLAAAISEENIGKFVLLCRHLLSNPSMKFFKKRIRSINKNLQNCIVIKFNYSPRSPDIIWGQIKRANKALTKQLELAGFSVLRSYAYSDEKKDAYLMFLLQGFTISENVVKEGPEFFDRDDSKKFISKNQKKGSLMWIGKDRKLRVVMKRRHTNAVSFLKDLIKNNLDRSGIPQGIKSDIKSYKIASGKKTLTKSIKFPLSELLTTNERIFYSN